MPMCVTTSPSLTKGISDEAVEAALATVGLDGWLHRLPDGLNSRLQTGGSNLSAGEAQLLAFARVLLRDPSVVLMDEAFITS